jgi:hypothetical protein
MLAVAAKAANLKKGYDELPPEKKHQTQLMGLAVALGVLYIGNKVVSGMGETFDFVTGKEKEENRIREENDFKEKVQSDLVKSGIRPTISEAKAKSIAQSLYAAMKGMGTNEPQIIGALNVLENAADWLMVSKAYGMPRGRTLSAELYHELDSKELRVIRITLQNINIKI